MSIERQWSYLAEDQNGATVNGALEAIDLQHALEYLKTRDLNPINIEETKSDSSLLNSLSRATKISAKDLTKFCVRMDDLLSAGISTFKALDIISEQSKQPSLSGLSERLREQIRKGQTLSAALKDDVINFPNEMIAIVTAGECLGDMGGAFARLAKSFESKESLRKEITGHLIYPAALLVLIVLTIIFLSFFVLPQFESVFSSASAMPPPETQFVIGAAAFIRQYWIIAATLLIGGVITLRLFIKHNTSLWDQLTLKLPVIGTLIEKIETAHYARSLGELLTGGMPLARAMPIAQAAVSNSSIKDHLDHIELEVKNGTPLSVAAEAASCLSPDILTFFKLGEETGDLDRMITKGASYLEQEVTSFLKKFATLSGPIMTAIMGLVTAGVIAAVMTGVLSLNDTIY